MAWRALASSGSPALGDIGNIIYRRYIHISVFVVLVYIFYLFCFTNYKSVSYDVIRS